MRSEARQTFQELIRAKREARGLSLSQVARDACLTKSHLHDLEKGRSQNPSINILFGLSRELDIHPHDLIDACFVSVRQEIMGDQ